MSHLHCAFTLRTKWKHQFDTYLVKIHLVVHEILSVSYFLLFFVMADGSHFGWSICEKILIPLRNDTSGTILALIHSEFFRIIIFMFLLFLLTAANGHLRLPSGINLKKFYCQKLILMYFWQFIHHILFNVSANQSLYQESFSFNVT